MGERAHNAYRSLDMVVFAPLAAAARVRGLRRSGSGTGASGRRDPGEAGQVPPTPSLPRVPPPARTTTIGARRPRSPCRRWRRVAPPRTGTILQLKPSVEGQGNPAISNEGVERWQRSSWYSPLTTGWATRENPPVS